MPGEKIILDIIPKISTLEERVPFEVSPKNLPFWLRRENKHEGPEQV